MAAPLHLVAFIQHPVLCRGVYIPSLHDRGQWEGIMSTTRMLTNRVIHLLCKGDELHCSFEKLLQSFFQFDIFSYVQ